MRDAGNAFLAALLEQSDDGERSGDSWTALELRLGGHSKKKTKPDACAVIADAAWTRLLTKGEGVIDQDDSRMRCLDSLTPEHPRQRRSIRASAVSGDLRSTRRLVRQGLAVAMLFVAGSVDVAAQQRALCVHDVPAGQVLRVRSGPALTAGIVGEFKSAACGVKLAGRCEGDWCVMALDGTKGWVDTRYIGIYELPDSAAQQTTHAPKDAEAAEPPKAAEQRTPSDLQTSTPTASTRFDFARATAATAAREAVRPIRGPDPGACVARVERWDTLRIRSGPGTRHDEIGAIPAGACRVERIGGCRGDWCQIAWRGRVGWVNSHYLD